MKKLLYILLFFSQVIVAQSQNELFSKANNQYKEEKYQEALNTYDSIEKLGYISSELYFNKGNCYYKLNKVAPTIYNYEKALIINPLNEDARNNLLFAKRLTIDNIEELPKTIFDKLNQSIVKKLSYNQWAFLTVIFCFLGSFLFLAFYFAKKSSIKRIYFVTSCFTFLLFITTFFITQNEYEESTTKVEAIVFAQEAIIKNAPTQNSDDIFTLHEGTKVLVLDSVDNWKKIKLAEGKQGWIISNHIKQL